MTAMDVRVTIRLPQSQADWCASLAERASEPGGVGVGLRLAAQSLQGLLAVELRGTGTWTVPELLLLAQAQGQAPHQSDAHGQLLAAELGDMVTDLEDQYAQSVGMESAAGVLVLRERVEAFTAGQDLAVRDALSRWWAGGHDGSVAGFRGAGFHVAGGRTS